MCDWRAQSPQTPIPTQPPGMSWKQAQASLDLNKTQSFLRNLPSTNLPSFSGCLVDRQLKGAAKRILTSVSTQVSEQEWLTGLICTTDAQSHHRAVRQATQENAFIRDYVITPRSHGGLFHLDWSLSFAMEAPDFMQLKLHCGMSLSLYHCSLKVCLSETMKEVKVGFFHFLRRWRFIFPSHFQHWTSAECR